MIQSFIRQALVNGEHATLIPIYHLSQVQEEIERFRCHAELKGFHHWVVNNLYTFAPPKVGFPVGSILLLAIPHPFYAQVEFLLNGKTSTAFSLVMSDVETTEKTLNTVVDEAGYHIRAVENLPLKRLAVQSGFAVYGRNNICYIDGLGSNFSLYAYFSDIPCDDAFWTEPRLASQCERCRACITQCPTSAIHSQSFVIDPERCLSYLNESGEAFPEWLPATVHHCVYDCLQCQMVCPMNREQRQQIVGPITFTEAETEMLLSGVPFETYPASLKEKTQYLGFHQWPDGLARNIHALIEQSL